MEGGIFESGGQFGGRGRVTAVVRGEREDLEMVRTFVVAAVFALFAATPMARAVVGTEVDTFQDGTTEGWTGGSSPVNIADGGPAGLGDRYLKLTANFSNMASYNPTQWSGNYTAAGITDIEADIMVTPGSDPGAIRLVIFGPTLSRWTSVNAWPIPADGAWHHVKFPLSLASMVNVLTTSDTYGQTLAGADRLMFRQDPGVATANGTPYTGSIGIDNVKAITVPEPASLALLAPLGLICARRRR
jgi:hypothetical protein